MQAEPASRPPPHSFEDEAPKVLRCAPAVQKSSGWLIFGLTIRAEGVAQIVYPVVGDFPGNEVAATLVNGDVDVVVPGCAITAQEMLHSILGRDCRRVLIPNKCDPGGSLDDGPAIMG